MRSVVLAAVLAGLMLMSPYGGLTISTAQTVEPSYQPDHVNNTLTVWGKDTVDSCWSHYGVNDTESEDGVSRLKSQDTGRLDITIRCDMKPMNQRYFLLEENSSYRLQVTFRWNGAQAVEELNVSLKMSGQGKEEFRESFMGIPADATNPRTVTRDVPVNRTGWNGSSDNPQLIFEILLQGDRTSPFPGIVQGTPAEFEIWFGPSYTFVEMPILNGSAQDTPIVDEDPNSEDTPGFVGWSALAGLVAAAAVSTWQGRSKREHDDA